MINATLTGQSITSPFWPDNYVDYQNCTWEINSDGVRGVRLQFTDFDFGYYCGGDYVTVYEDQAKSDTLCGRSDVNRTFTARRTLRVVFISDHLITEKGYRAIVSLGKQGNYLFLKFVKIYLDQAKNN